ncbi:MAG: hypothetical protein ACFCVC_06845 [Acidimicrobiia bacterium]
MAGHICDNCGAAVADEQFCPTCGAWVDPLQNDGEGEFEEFSLGATPAGEPAPPARLPRQEVQCPSCGSANPTSNRHCEECGARLSQGALPVAPRPAVQTTAGVRAAMGISAVLLVVILAVVMVNIFSGEDDPSTTTLLAAGETTSTTAARLEPVPLSVIAVECRLGSQEELETIAGFDCANLIDGETGSQGEFQFNWIALEPGAGNPTITLKFNEQVSIRSILWSNIEDPDRYAQNYKVARISITDDTGIPLPTDLDNEPGLQVIPYVALPTFELVIEITAPYSATDVDGNVFEDMAIAEIQVLGNPAGVGAAPTTPDPATDNTTDNTTDTTGGG